MATYKKRLDRLKPRYPNNEDDKPKFVWLKSNKFNLLVGILIGLIIGLII